MVHISKCYGVTYGTIIFGTRQKDAYPGMVVDRYPPWNPLSFRTPYLSALS